MVEDSPSPACFPTLPFAVFLSASAIREAIVKILARPAFGQPSQEPHDRDDSLDAILLEDSLNPSLRGHQLPKDPTTCVFWCAVALGALVKGNPIESVRTRSNQVSRSFKSFWVHFPSGYIFRTMSSLPPGALSFLHRTRLHSFTVCLKTLNMGCLSNTS